MKTIHQDISMNITNSLMQANKNAIEFIGDVTEFSVDQLISDGVVKDIPWVGWIAKITSIYSSYTDRIFLAKVARFLFRLESLDKEEKLKFARKLKNDEKYRKNVGNKLVLLIESINDLHKCDILAAVFDHYITEYISYEDFDRIAHAIQQASLSDLFTLRHGNKANYDGLLASGLSRIVRLNTLQPTHGDTEFELTLELSNAGSILQKIINNNLKIEKYHNEKLMEQVFAQ